MFAQHNRSHPHMDAAILFQLAHPAASPHHVPPLHYSYLAADRVADRRTFADNSSYVRSSAPRQMQHHHQFNPSSYRSTYSMDSSSSGSGSFVAGSSPMASPFEVAEPELRAAAVSGGQPYQPEQYSQTWGVLEQPQHSQYADPYASGSYELPPTASASTSTDGPMMHSAIKSEEHIESFGNMYMTSYTDMQNSLPDPQQQSPLTSYALTQYHADSSAAPQLHFSYGPDHQPQPSGAQDVANMSPFMLSAAPPQLQYPDYSQDGEVARYVNPSQVSPAISPSSPYAQLQEAAPSQSLDPRFTMNNPLQPMAGTGGSGSDLTDFEVDSNASSGDSPALANALAATTSAPIPVPVPGRKRQRSVSYTSSDEDESQSGYSDRDEDDDEYVQSPRARRRQEFTPAMSPTTSTGSGSMSVGSRRLAPPVPVPNLTKKSRGRRVPTAQQVVSEGAMQKVRHSGAR